MKNDFSPILLMLKDVIKEQGGFKKAWADGVNVIETQDAEGNTLWWTRHSGTDTVLSEAELALLDNHNLVANEGKPSKKRFGVKYVFCVCVKASELEKKVREQEANASQLQIIRRDNKRLEQELKAARSEAAHQQAMVELIQHMKDSFKLKGDFKPVKFDRSKPAKNKALAGVPSLMLSDWHWGEVVAPEQIEYLNEFDLAIANQRADRVFSKTLELLFHHQSGMTYDGMTVILGGDMFSGNIHEELRYTNDAPIHECLLTLAEKLAGGIIQIADNFPWVYVPGVVGNHGRIDRKPTAKYAVQDNYDWLLYNFVMMLVRGRMGDKCNVEFDVSPSLDHSFKLYGTNYLLTHGDQISGGAGVGGFWPAMMKVAHRKQQRAVKGGLGGFDYMVCGHFHKYGNVANVIVNGSLKGYDEWVYKMNFEWERPTQALWTTHPEYGIINHIPVYGDDIEKDGAILLPPVTPSSGIKRIKK